MRVNALSIHPRSGRWWCSHRTVQVCGMETTVRPKRGGGPFDLWRLATMTEWTGASAFSQNSGRGDWGNPSSAAPLKAPGKQSQRRGNSRETALSLGKGLPPSYAILEVDPVPKLTPTSLSRDPKRAFFGGRITILRHNLPSLLGGNGRGPPGIPGIKLVRSELSAGAGIRRLVRVHRWAWRRARRR